MALHNEIGLQGEKLAGTYLAKKGYRIVVKNWRHGRGEVDLIAEYQGILVFVEVKTRSSTSYGQPDEFVGPKKVQMLAAAACAYIEHINYQGEIRFDILSVILPPFDDPQISHIPDAFFPGLG